MWTFYHAEMVRYWLTVARLQRLKRCLLKLQHDIYVEMTCIPSVIVGGGAAGDFEIVCCEVGHQSYFVHWCLPVMDDRPHSEVAASGWVWTSWTYFCPRSYEIEMWPSTFCSLLHLLCYYSPREGLYLPQHSECGWNNHSRQKHDCCAWAHSHCSGISANKELNALLCMNVCGACAWILWDGRQWCCQAGKWGWQSGRWAVLTWGRGQRGWTTHEYYGMMVVLGGMQCMWGVKIAMHMG